MFQYQDNDVGEASNVEVSKEEETKESLTRKRQRFNLPSRQHLLERSKEIALTSPSTRISKYQLQKQKRSPIRNAKVDRKDRLASRRSSIGKNMPDDDCDNGLTSRRADHVNTFNQEVSINHFLLSAVKKRVDSDTAKTSSKRGRSSSLDDDFLTGGKSIKSRVGHGGSDSNNSNTRSKKRPSEGIAAKNIVVAQNDMRRHQKQTKRIPVEDKSDNEESLKSRDMESEAGDMGTRAKVSKEKDTQVVTTIKAKDSNRKRKRRRDWSAEEDEALRSSIKKNKEGGWATNAKEVSGRTGEQCYHRWDKSLKFSLGELKNPSKWSPEEDAMIIMLQREKGNKWTAIANALPNARTAFEVRNHFNRHLICTPKNGKDLVIDKLVDRLKEQEVLKEEMSQLLAKNNGKDLVIKAQNKEMKEQLAKNDEKDSVIEALKKEMKEQLAKSSGKDIVNNAQNKEIERLKEQSAQLNERESATEARNTEIKRLKQQIAKNNSVIEVLNNINSGKDTVIFSQMKEIERLKQKLSKKNEKNLVIDELIERLKQQLSNKMERESVIVALIERLQKQLPKKNQKDSVIEALNKKIYARNVQFERLKQQLAKAKHDVKLLKLIRKQTDAAKMAKVDVEVDPLDNFPLGSKTILVGDCYNCDVCKEAYFYSYDEACYHENLCKLYRDSIAAKARLEKVNKAFVEKMKSINTKKSSGNSSAAEMNAPDSLKTSPVKEKNREESMNKQVQEMQALSKDLQEDLQCPICFNPMKDPCIVPECCHRFCYACIEDAIAKCGKECPVCRARITSKRGLRRDELFGKITEVVCRNDEEEEGIKTK